jgi:hypothetical protein
VGEKEQIKTQKACEENMFEVIFCVAFGFHYIWHSCQIAADVACFYL